MCRIYNVFSIGQKLKNAKLCCNKLNKEGFGNIQHRTKEALSQLENIQNSLMRSPTDSLFRDEFVARQKWNFFAKAQETFYKQNSRVRWLKDGDANTSFFHKTVIENQARNSIKYLRDTDNNRIYNQARVKDMAESFFSNMLGTENTVVVSYIVDQIPNIHPYRCTTDLAMKLTVIQQRRR